MPVTGMYVLQGVDPTAVAAAPFDVKIVDAYNDNGQLFTSSQVQQMKSTGSELLGYFSIGEAENYRDYFSSIPASALGPENPQWPGDYEVAYWTPEWRSVATAYIDKLISAGYDGAYFDVVDECLTPWAQQNAPGGAPGAERAMVDLVRYLKDYANAKAPGFQIWANNAEELLKNPEYLGIINGMVKENLFYTDTGAKQPASETSYSIGLLNLAVAAGKPVLDVEYVFGPAQIADVQAKAATNGIGSYIANLDLNGIDPAGILPGQSITPYIRSSVSPAQSGSIITDSANATQNSSTPNVTLMAPQNSSTLIAAQTVLPQTSSTSSATPTPMDNAVAQLYHATLNRAPDAAGLQAWDNSAANGLSLNTIAQDFVSSSEHQALYGPQTNQEFVDALYHAALGRAPDAPGEQAWVHGLDQGLSLGTVALDFAQCTEAEQHLAQSIESLPKTV